MLDAQLQDHDYEGLRNEISQRAKVTKTSIERAVEAVKTERAELRKREEQERRQANRADPRPLIRVPSSMAPWIPQMEILSDVLGRSTAPEPPARDADGFIVQVHTRPPLHMHTLTAKE